MTCSHCQGIELQFDDRVARRQLRRLRKKGPSKTTTWLLDAIVQEGIDGRTFLDVGGGVGAIQQALMERGAVGGTHSDASPAYLAAARSEAEVGGYADRVEYLGGDFVDRASELEPADVVTLDRVICCYPDMPGMLDAAAPLASRTMGLVIPRNTRPIRFAIAFVNLFQRLRRHPFRVFVHDPEAVASSVEAHGLSKRFRRESFMWQVLVFTRREPLTPASE